MPKKTTKKPATKKKTAARKTARKRAAAKPRAEVKTNGTELTETQIRERAYAIFRAGRNPSDPVADWLQAERELRAEHHP